MQLSTNLPFSQMITKWAAILNPIIASPMTNMGILKNIALANGSTVINHNLAKTMQGWTILDITSAATIYRSAPFNDKTLTLTSNAACVVTIGVF